MQAKAKDVACLQLNHFTPAWPSCLLLGLKAPTLTANNCRHIDHRLLLNLFFCMQRCTKELASSGSLLLL